MAQTNEKPICEVSEYYGDNVFMLVSRVNKAVSQKVCHNHIKSENIRKPRQAAALLGFSILY